MMRLQLVISCEHASNHIPKGYQHLFKGAEEELNSHIGWDPGAIEVSRSVAEAFDVKPFIYPYTRLLIEPNRSLDNAQLFSRYSQSLDEKEKSRLIENYYQPHRNAVETEIRQMIEKGPVLHLGIHTFTPIWNGEKRQVDIGVLFDPNRSEETRFSNRLIEILKQRSDFEIEANEPYKGTEDGFTTYLRTLFGEGDYLGLEIEISQGLDDKKRVVGDLIVDSLKIVFEEFKKL
ncbi:MAG: N-formylglutamate amidohydrolase [Bacteroidota bacterium]